MYIKCWLYILRITLADNTHDKINLNFDWLRAVQSASCHFSCLKTYSCKLIPNWTWNRAITYTNFLCVYFSQLGNLRISEAWGK